MNELKKRLGLTAKSDGRDLQDLKDRLGLGLKNRKKRKTMGRSEEVISTFTCERCKATHQETNFDEESLPEKWIEVGDLAIGRGERDFTGETWCRLCVESFLDWHSAPTRKKDSGAKELHS